MKRRSYKNVIGLILFLGIFFVQSRSAGEIYLSISKKYGDKIKTGLCFENSLEAEVSAAMVTDILGDDLRFSGNFSVPENLSLNNETLALSVWLKMGAEVLIKGKVSTPTDEMVEIEFTVISVSTGEEVLRKKYKTERQNLRQLVHTIADEIVFRLTGDKGITASKISFVSDLHGNKNIYIMDYDGFSKKRITLNKSTNIFPAYGPDGKFVAFTSYMDGPPYLYTISSTGNISLISKRPGMNSLPNVSKDSLVAAVLSKDGNPEIYTMTSNGLRLKRITNHKAIDSSPSWSPDGKEIVFVSNRNRNPQLYIVNVKNKKVRRLTREGNYNTDPSWSPKGNLIAFSSLISGTFQICVGDVETGEIRQLTDDTYNNESPSWAPNGVTLVYTASKKGKAFLNLIDIYEKKSSTITSYKKDGSCTNPSFSF